MHKAGSKDKDKAAVAPTALVPHCSKTVARAHTIPKRMALQKLARDGHVYGFPMNSIIKAFTPDGVPVARLIGINEASTFTGFCVKHDNDIFAPLEKSKFIGTPEQCFLLAYRAHTREVFTKRASASMSDFRRSMDKGRSQQIQRGHQAMSKLYDIALGAGLNDVNYYKERLDQILISGTFDQFHSYVAHLEDVPVVMCSGGFFPLEDFHGNFLQDLADLNTPPAMITVTIFSDDDKGYLVLSWLKDNDPICKQFAESLSGMKAECYASAVARMVFYHTENVFMNPIWWESLSEGVRSMILRRIVMAVDLTDDYAPGKKLVDDGLRIPSWKVADEIRIGY